MLGHIYKIAPKIVHPHAYTTFSPIIQLISVYRLVKLDKYFLPLDVLFLEMLLWGQSVTKKKQFISSRRYKLGK